MEHSHFYATHSAGNVGESDSLVHKSHSMQPNSHHSSKRIDSNQGIDVDIIAIIPMIYVAYSMSIMAIKPLISVSYNMSMVAMISTSLSNSIHVYN